MTKSKATSQRLFTLTSSIWFGACLLVSVLVTLIPAAPDAVKNANEAKTPASGTKVTAPVAAVIASPASIAASTSTSPTTVAAPALPAKGKADAVVTTAASALPPSQSSPGPSGLVASITAPAHPPDAAPGTAMPAAPVISIPKATIVSDSEVDAPAPAVATPAPAAATPTAASTSKPTATLVSAGPPADPEAVKFFENKIRPLLADQCFKCHSDKKQKGGLRLDSLEAARQGGDGGAAVTPGDLDHSLLYKAVTYEDQDLQMPPDNKLEPGQIADLKKWIQAGAPWPSAGADTAATSPAHKPGEFNAEDRAWWAFQPIKKITPPKLKPASQDAPYVVQNPIDQFVLAKLQKEGLPQAPEADRAELLRRVTFDLHGLPPTAEEFEALMAEKDPLFYEHFVDQLLNSPRYGERWAQFWLDLVRYAESDGFRQDAYRTEAWRYRDYVVRALNTDKPYDQFVREQIAGDELNPEDPDALTATAYMRHPVYEYNQRDADAQRTAVLNDITDVTGETFMALSFGCARCHDHKFDPILQKDYYRLQAFFAPIIWRDDLMLGTPQQKENYGKQLVIWEAATSGIRSKFESALKNKITLVRRKQVEKFPEDVQQMYHKSDSDKTPYEKQICYFVGRQADEEAEIIRTGKGKGKSAYLAGGSYRAQLKAYDPIKPVLPQAFAVTDVGPEAPPVTFKSRRSGEVEVKPGFLTLLDPADAAITPPKDLPSTGRRSALANWLTDPANPLVARVIVNRVWQYHFGTGLVSTASDFGRLGEKPSHPELLDWLTSEFMSHHWSIKWLHRTILTSATYRQTARLKPTEQELLKDPQNRWLWRMSPRRLDASQARDALLVMSGELQAPHHPSGEEPQTPCRTIFTKKIRNHQDEFLRDFDSPAGFQSVARRDETNTALQSLLMINGDWPLRRANAMAANLFKANGREIEAAVGDAYEVTYSRPPRPAEIKAALTFINQQKKFIEGSAGPHVELANPLVDTKYMFGELPYAGAQSVLFKPNTSFEKIHVVKSGDREADEFTIEAIIYLDSVYTDGSVRTIMSRWNGDKTTRGWSLGITGKGAGSRYEPNTLLMQLVGEDFQRSIVFENLASNIHIPLKTPYYVAAVVTNHNGPDQTSGGMVTFYAKNLTNPKAPLETTVLTDQLVGGYVDPNVALMVGGRDTEPKSLWDGLMARATLENGAISVQQLLINGNKELAPCLFDLQGSTLDSTSEPLYSWEQASTGKRHLKNSTAEAFADFCHALINSNEFLYLY